MHVFPYKSHIARVESVWSSGSDLSIHHDNISIQHHEYFPTGEGW